MMVDSKKIKETIKIAGHSFILERVKNLDELVDQITDELFNEDERLPYWAELWPSARALTEFILQSPNIFKKKDVLELGCGLGLTSMALASVVPKSLLVTDYEEEALQTCAQNFVLNKIAVHPTFKQLDWRDATLDSRYERIVASDVAYEERFFQPLIDLFSNYLAENGRVILAEPNRNIARTFFGKLALADFDFSSSDKFVIQDGKTIKVTIYQIYRIKALSVRVR